jgi:hypothetical protein
VSATSLPLADPWRSPDIERGYGGSQTPLPVHLALEKSVASLAIACHGPVSGES